MASLKSSSFPISIENFSHKVIGILETTWDELKSSSLKVLPEKISLIPSNESRILSPSPSSMLHSKFSKRLPLPGQMQPCGAKFLLLVLTSHKHPLHHEARRSTTAILPAIPVQWLHPRSLEQCSLQQHRSFLGSRPTIPSPSLFMLPLEVGARSPQMFRCQIALIQALE